jgi:hypothetical protein
MRLVSGSWPESLVSKVNVGWLFLGPFFKIDLLQFHSLTFNLFEIGLLIFSFFLFYWVIMILCHDPGVYGLTWVN